MILRDPVDRFFSQYRMSFSKGDTNLSPDEFLETDTEAFERGLYAKQLKRYIDCFGIDNILVLFYEDIFSDGEASAVAGLHEIGNFLGISNDKWVLDGVSRQVGRQGSAGRPKFFGAYRLAVKFRQYCMDKDMEWLVLLGKKMGIGKNSFGSVSNLPKVDRKYKDLLWERYRNDVHELESLIKRKLDIWGPHKYG